MDTEPRPRRFGPAKAALTGFAGMLLFGVAQPAFAQEAPAPRDENPLDLSTVHPPLQASDNPEWWRSGGSSYDAPTWDLMVRLADVGQGFASQRQIDLFRYRMAHGETRSPWYDEHADDYGGPQGMETSGSVDRHKVRLGVRIPFGGRHQ